MKGTLGTDQFYGAIRYFDADPTLLLEDANKTMRPKFHDLNEALVRMVRTPRKQPLKN